MREILFAALTFAFLNVGSVGAHAQSNFDDRWVEFPERKVPQGFDRQIHEREHICRWNRDRCGEPARHQSLRRGLGDGNWLPQRRRQGW